MKSYRCPLGWVMLLLAVPVNAGVVINEIFYHAPNDLTDLQWIEVHNAADQPANLAGWTLTKGVKFAFPTGTTLPPQGYVVICKNADRFRQFYEVPVAGEFAKTLKRSGDQLELRNAAGDVVDAVPFADRAPWPSGPDGWSASLERICPAAPGHLAENWASSPLTEDRITPGGTPGKPNAAFSAHLPPVIRQVHSAPARAEPGQAITVTAEVPAAGTLREVTLRYRIAAPGSAGEEQSLPMRPSEGERYAATIPGQPAGRIVRFRVQAIGTNSAQRFYPEENDPRPALSCLVATNVTPAKAPFGFIIHTDPTLAQSAQRQRRPGGGRGGPFGEEGRARFMAEIQFRSALDLAELWAALVLTNAPTAALDPLRLEFARMSLERNQLEARTLGAADLAQTTRRIPDVVKSFQARLGDALKPLLAPQQLTVFEAWRDRAPARGGPFGFDENPALLLRQFVRLEPALLHLATRTNVAAAQFASLCDVYRDAIQRRDALAADARSMMSPDGDREALQAKLEAIETGVQQKLKEVLTPGQARELAAWREQDRPAFMRGPGDDRRSATSVPATSAFVFVDPRTREPQLFDFVQVAERKGGWKVHFGKDRELNGMTTINLIFEANDRWLLAEPLAYEMYRRAGVAACLTDFVRLWIDGEPVGYHLLIEQPNKAFLRRNGLRDDGNLYKLLWYERGIVGQHEKKTNPLTGHDDVVQLVEALERAKADPAREWEVIQREFDVNQVATHYAVRTLISDWDGFFNNYFAYHDLNGTKKWTLYPWDEDQTWGDMGGFGNTSGLSRLPLTYGAEGDKPPGWQGDRAPVGFMGPGRGGAPWWRPGGWFSKPLLANPAFRERYLARLKDLLDREFTGERLFPLVAQMQDRLQEEIRFRAQLLNEPAASAQERFERNLASIKDHITQRRQWLLDQEEIRSAGRTTSTK